MGSKFISMAEPCASDCPASLNPALSGRRLSLEAAWAAGPRAGESRRWFFESGVQGCGEEKAFVPCRLVRSARPPCASSLAVQSCLPAFPQVGTGGPGALCCWEVPGRPPPSSSELTSHTQSCTEGPRANSKTQPRVSIIPSQEGARTFFKKLRVAELSGGPYSPNLFSEKSRGIVPHSGPLEV